MPMRKPAIAPQYAEMSRAEQPHMGDYSALAEQFLRPRANKQIHSVGQGFVEAGADIASALLAKRAMKRDQEKQDRAYSLMDMATQFVANPELRRDDKTGAVWDKSDFSAPIFDQDKVNAAPALDASQRANIAADLVGREDPRLGAQSRLGLLELAQQFDQGKKAKDREAAYTRLSTNQGEYAGRQADIAAAFPDEMRAKQARSLGLSENDYGQPVAGTDANGRAVYRRFDGSSVGGEVVPDFFPAKDTEGRGTEAERERQQLLQDGVDPTDAADIAYNRVRVSRSPVDGSILLVNIRDGSARAPRMGASGGRGGAAPQIEAPSNPMARGGNAAPPPVPGREAMQGEQVPVSRQPLLAKVGVLGGAAPVQEAAGRVSMGGYDPGAALNEARQEFRLFENDVYDMMGGLDRMSNQDRERIQKMFASPGIFESDTRAYDLMASWSKEAQNIVQQQERVFQDPTQPPELRKAAAAKIEAASRLMERVGDPLQIPRPGGGTGNIGQMSLEQLSGLDPSRMSSLELQQAAERWKALEGK